MKKSIFVLLLIGCTSLTAQSIWKADKSHSKVAFAIEHLKISEISGHFSDFDIEAKADSTFANPVFNVEIKTASINTDNSARDNHLRSDDFFGAETHPTISFKSTSYEKSGDKTFKLNGELSIHGITRPITLNGKVNGIITDPRSKKLRAGLKLTGTIDRLAFKVGDDTPTLGSEIEITINLEMAQR